MRALGVEMDPPSGDLLAGLAQGSEQVQVQALVPELDVEAPNKGILCGLAGPDEVQTNAGPFGKFAVSDVPSKYVGECQPLPARLSGQVFAGLDSVDWIIAALASGFLKAHAVARTYGLPDGLGASTVPPNVRMNVVGSIGRAAKRERTLQLRG